jgi:hypothetical protein
VPHPRWPSREVRHSRHRPGHGGRATSGEAGGVRSGRSSAAVTGEVGVPHVMHQRSRAVADAVRAVVRPYELLVRFGENQFVCAMPGTSVQEATARMAAVNVDLLA